MKKVIRTIMAFYNGMEFIEMQVDSILAQEGIEDFDHQLYIYDDGSKKESLDEIKTMYGNNKSIKIIDGVNEGPYYRFIMGFIDAIEEKVDYVFFADQDDYFYPHKYKDHIKGHNKFNKGMIISSDNVWDYKNNTKKPIYKNGKGHNFSIDINRFNDKFKYDINTFKVTIEETKKHFISYFYHDFFLTSLFTSINEAKGLWGNITSDHRVHENSVTKSKSYDGKPWRIWADQYNYYFIAIKPFLKKVFDINQSIKMFNYKFFFSDINASEGQSLAGLIKWKLDNFAMRVHWRWARNIVQHSINKGKTTKEGRKLINKLDEVILINESKKYWK